LFSVVSGQTVEWIAATVAGGSTSPSIPHRARDHNQRQRRAHGGDHIPNRILKPLSLKPWLTSPSAVTTTGRRISCEYSRSSSFHSASLAGAVRLSGSCRPVVEDMLNIAAKPPSLPAHSTSVSGVGLWSR